jgi:hypothetical protein
MSTQISELYVHRPGAERMELVTVTESMTVAEAVGLEAGEAVWIEEAEEELLASLPLVDVGISHRGHVHVNRCRKVNVSMTYNGTRKEHTFAPATKVERVRKWALSKKGFGIDPVDAAELLLVLGGTTTKIDLKDHIGSFVGAGCAVSLDLISKPKTEG